jgi:D-tagatose-1,6-bisphosphate aldolase subunit GatZ/KbaZ
MIHAYNRAEAVDLARFIETVPGLIFEAHSTDYQTREDLRALIEDHYGILKVGPALTFAFREAVFALAEIEEIEVESKTSNIRNVLEGAMLSDPTRWQKHYGGTSHDQKVSRFYSYSDRIRYYWNIPEVEKAFVQLLCNLGKEPLPLSLLSQYLPTQYEKVRRGEMINTAYNLILGQVSDVLDDYRYACGW